MKTLCGSNKVGPKIKFGEGAKTVVWPYDQVVKVREGLVDLEPMLLVNFKVAKWANILLDTPSATSRSYDYVLQ